MLCIVAYIVHKQFVRGDYIVWRKIKMGSVLFFTQSVFFVDSVVFVTSLDENWALSVGRCGSAHNFSSGLNGQPEEFHLHSIIPH